MVTDECRLSSSRFKLFEYFELYIQGSLFGKGTMFIEWYKGQS